jgi:hypothetical protein
VRCRSTKKIGVSAKTLTRHVPEHSAISTARGSSTTQMTREAQLVTSEQWAHHSNRELSGTETKTGNGVGLCSVMRFRGFPLHVTASSTIPSQGMTRRDQSEPVHQGQTGARSGAIPVTACIHAGVLTTRKPAIPRPDGPCRQRRCCSYIPEIHHVPT